MIVIVFLCAVVAFSLSAVCGGGAGLLLMPVLGIYLPASRLPAALSIGTTFSSLSRVVIFYKNVRWNIVTWFVPAAIPSVVLGAFLLRFINPFYLEVIMSVFLIGNLPEIFRKKLPAAQEQANSKIQLLVIGVLAGFLSGLTGAVGLLFNRFYLKYGMTKEEIVATRAANEIILHIIKLILYGFFGLFNGDVISIGIAVAVAGVCSSWGIKWALKFISEISFRKIGYGAMVISGFSMLTQSTTGIFSQNNAHLTWAPFANGVESKLQWQDSQMSIEFEYNEGFEFEEQIPLTQLPEDKQQYVLAKKGDADRIVIEEVFGIGTHSYEAYFFVNDRLSGKMDFE